MQKRPAPLDTYELATSIVEVTAVRRCCGACAVLLGLGLDAAVLTQVVDHDPFYLAIDLTGTPPAEGVLQVNDTHMQFGPGGFGFRLGKDRGFATSGTSLGAELIVTRRENQLRWYWCEQLQHASLVAPDSDVRLSLDLNRELPKLPLQKLGEVHFTDDFTRAEFGGRDGWELIDGRWLSQWDPQRLAAPNPFRCCARPDAGRGAVMVSGYSFWSDYHFSASVRPQADAAVGLVFAYRSPQAYHRLLLDLRETPCLRLERCDPEGFTPITVHPVAAIPGNWLQLELSVFEGRALRVRIDGLEIVDYPLSMAPFGKIGLCAEGGETEFDDVAVTAHRTLDFSWQRPLHTESRMYRLKPRYTEDNRDDHLDRWARDRDAWQPHLTTIDGQPTPGFIFHLPLFREFSMTAPPGTAAWVGVLPPNEPPHRCVARGSTPLQGKRVAVAAYGAQLERDGLPDLRAAHVWQDLFDGAPVAWYPVGGNWQTTNRWQCENRWHFFGAIGPDLVAQFSKLRCHGDQVHEFYFGMKDVFGRQFENRRYARHDVNFSLLTDGRNLFSGYTLMFGAFDNTATVLYRRDEEVARNESLKFEPFVDIDDLHLFWRRLRVELDGKRLLALLDDELIFDYTETADDLPSSGQSALWTRRNGIVYARYNASAARIEPSAAVRQLVAKQETAGWQAADGNVEIKGDAVRNLIGGGLFAVTWTPTTPIDLGQTPLLHFSASIPADCKVSLHCVVAGQAFIVPLTAPLTETYRVLGDPMPLPTPWWLYGCQPLSLTGNVQSTVSDISIDLRAYLPEALRAQPTLPLQRLTVGNTSQHRYLQAGLSGNPADAVYHLGVPAFSAP